MLTPDNARKYLLGEFVRLGVDMASASREMGRNHAYLQQYIRRGKPRWLPEDIREGLARLYEIDEARLKPPPADLSPAAQPATLTGNGSDKGDVHAKRRRKVVDDARQLELLEIWDAMRDDRRDLAISILRSLARDGSAVVV